MSEFTKAFTQEVITDKEPRQLTSLIPVRELHTKLIDNTDNIDGEAISKRIQTSGPMILKREAEDLENQADAIQQAINNIIDTIPGGLHLREVAEIYCDTNHRAADAFREMATRPISQNLPDSEYSRLFVATRGIARIGDGKSLASVLGSSTTNGETRYDKIYMGRRDSDDKVFTEELLINQGATTSIVNRRTLINNYFQTMGVETRRSDAPEIESITAWGLKHSGKDQPPTFNEYGSQISATYGFLGRKKLALTVPNLGSPEDIEETIRIFSMRMIEVLKAAADPSLVRENLHRINPSFLYGTPIHPLSARPHPMYQTDSWIQY